MSRSIVILFCLLFAWPAAPAPGSPRQQPVILVYGDSLSAGYGVAIDKGWASLLANRVQREGYGLSAHTPSIVIVELGANDGLRGLPLDTTRTNLEAIMSLAAADHRAVLLLGMRMPPNYGERYTLGFADVFPELAHRHRAALVPFLLEGVADRPNLMQPDGLHPNERGQAVLLDNVWPVLRPLLQKRQL